jgi:hypothetical protein
MFTGVHGREREHFKGGSDVQAGECADRRIRKKVF